MPPMPLAATDLQPQPPIPRHCRPDPPPRPGALALGCPPKPQVREVEAWSPGDKEGDEAGCLLSTPSCGHDLASDCSCLHHCPQVQSPEVGRSVSTHLPHLDFARYCTLTASPHLHDLHSLHPQSGAYPRLCCPQLVLAILCPELFVYDLCFQPFARGFLPWFSTHRWNSSPTPVKSAAGRRTNSTVFLHYSSFGSPR